MACVKLGCNATAGAGVGKGRTIAGLVLENWRCGRRRHLWLTIGTDLRIDSRRDLDDVGAAEIPLHPLNKLPYGQLDSDKVARPASLPASCPRKQTIHAKAPSGYQAPSSNSASGRLRVQSTNRAALYHGAPA